MAVDTSNFTLDTPVKIKILEPGVYVPELSTYTPLECYASIDQAITILNRGVEVEFPAQEGREISIFIEDLLLSYEEKKQSIKKHYGEIGTNVTTALETIQSINDSKITPEEEKEYDESKIFEYTDVAERIVSNLRDGGEFRHLTRLADNNTEDVLEREKKERKARERNSIRKKEALELARLEAETFLKLMQDGKMDFDPGDDSL